MRANSKFRVKRISVWLIPFLAIFLMTSCKNLKQNNLMKASSKKFINNATDSIYTRKFDLKKHKVFTYTSGMLRAPKFKKSENKDTTIMTSRIAIKGINEAGEMLKKEIEWNIGFVKEGDQFRMISSESRVVRDISLWRQILNSFLITVIFFWVFMGTTGGLFLNMKGKEVILILIFSIIMLISGIFLFGSFIISLLNAFFFLFLLAAFSGYAAANSKK